MKRTSFLMAGILVFATFASAQHRAPTVPNGELTDSQYVAAYQNTINAAKSSVDLWIKTEHKDLSVDDFEKQQGFLKMDLWTANFALGEFKKKEIDRNIANSWLATLRNDLQTYKVGDPLFLH
jgi:hypothetical protein